MDVRFKPNDALAAKIKDYMAQHGVSAPRAVRAMLGDMTALYGHTPSQSQPKNEPPLLGAAVPVHLSVWDDTPDIKEIGRPGYVRTVVKNFIFQMEKGDCILVQSFTDRQGNQVNAGTVAACIGQIYKSGTFSVITRGVPAGQYIIRRNV